MDLERFKFYYRPENSSVLHEQQDHISERLFDGRVDPDRIVRARHCAHGIFGRDGVQLHDKVIEAIYYMGFYGVYRCGFADLDNHLITALIERWRPETHTFHLRVGEATVTLEDVAVIWELPIDGRPIIGVDECPDREGGWRAYCQELLGFTPGATELKGSRLKVSMLRDFINSKEISNDTVPYEVNQVARCVALLLIGGVMCPDTSGTFVSLLYLRHLAKVTEVVEYSWGSAVLAHLYRELCDSAGKRDDAKIGDIGGALQLLQIWAWSRMSRLRPSIQSVPPKSLMPITLNYGLELPRAPYGARWTCRNSWTHTARHNIRIFRDMLDNMKPSEFTWMPYDYRSDLMRTLPPYCGKKYWRVNCPLLNYHIVEQHEVYRCMRQFGQVQDIPVNPEVPHKVYHRTTRRGKGGHDWEAAHADHIRMWVSQRGESVHASIITNPNYTTVSGYEMWYAQHTRQLITPPNQHIEIGYRPTEVEAWLTVEDQMHQLSLSCDAQSEFSDPESYRRFVDSVRNCAENVYSLALSVIDCSYQSQAAHTRSQRRRYNSNTRTHHDEAGPSRTQPNKACPSIPQCDVAEPSHQYENPPSPSIHDVKPHKM